MSCVSIVAVLYRTCVVPLRHHVRLLRASPTKWEGGGESRRAHKRRLLRVEMTGRHGCCSAKGQLWLEDEPKKYPPSSLFYFACLTYIYDVLLCVSHPIVVKEWRGRQKPTFIVFLHRKEKKINKWVLGTWEGTIRAALLMPTTRLLYRHEELTQKLRGGTGERTQTTNNN